MPLVEEIDSSWEHAAFEAGASFGGAPWLRVQHGWRGTRYPEPRITEVAEIDADAYRSAAGAAVGAIVGGVLTGGIGLLAGAAIGGRRKREASFFVHLDDGNHLAFTTRHAATIRAWRQRAMADESKRRSRDLAEK